MKFVALAVGFAALASAAPRKRVAPLDARDALPGGGPGSWGSSAQGGEQSTQAPAYTSSAAGWESTSAAGGGQSTSVWHASSTCTPESKLSLQAKRKT